MIKVQNEGYNSNICDRFLLISRSLRNFYDGFKDRKYLILHPVIKCINGRLSKTYTPYLNEKQNIIRLILFTSLFALVFINAYSPFGADRWYNLTRLEFFTYSSLTILIGVLVVVISRIIMYHVV